MGALLAPACFRRPPLILGLGNSETGVERCGQSGHPATLGQEGGGTSLGVSTNWAAEPQWVLLPLSIAARGRRQPHLPGEGSCRKSKEVIQEEMRSKDP